LALAGQFAIGWFIWTLLEYWLHRTMFHWTPKFSWGERFHFILHGVHHTWFQDRFRLVMPPAASMAIGVVVWALMLGFAAALAFAFDPSWTWAVFAGVMFGYLCYDMVHYYVHHGRPTVGWLKALRAHHAKHHHNPTYAERKFGVSTTIWDHVFGTY
jgi:sterol desaturase/sphingolipid hydroxylase (fatty acid hydroxylase superfamily)